MNALIASSFLRLLNCLLYNMVFKTFIRKQPKSGETLVDKSNTPYLDLVLSFHRNLSPSSADATQLPTMEPERATCTQTHESVFSRQQQTTLPIVEEDEALDSPGPVPGTGCSYDSSVYGGSTWFSRTFYKKALATRSLPQFNSETEDDDNPEEYQGGMTTYTSTLFKAKSLPSITLTVQRSEAELDCSEFIEDSSSRPHCPMSGGSTGNNKRSPVPRTAVPLIGPVPLRSSFGSNCRPVMASHSSSKKAKENITGVAGAKFSTGTTPATTRGRQFKPAQAFLKLLRHVLP